MAPENQIRLELLRSAQGDYDLAIRLMNLTNRINDANPNSIRYEWDEKNKRPKRMRPT